MDTMEIHENDSKLVQPKDVFFALDIGTRSVIGTVGIVEDDLVRVIDVESIEHIKRAMIDGQIEDIAQVSRIAQSVKEQLEKRLGYSLIRVNVAAAGRALKTYQVKSEIELERSVAIDNATVSQLEMNAITSANEAIQAELMENRNTQFYCVGYSVMKYYLDDYSISTLLGHKGEIAKVEMIVTFLPNEVVESLYSAMSSIDLSIESLTLEPIAAMNAVIPQELRMLNLALVDIGAGTSDIAISNDGSVTAYAMATIAGDEITDALTQKYLVDFNTAERMKHDLSLNAAEISYSDILGNDYTVPVSEVTQTVQPALEHLCTVICEKITEVNKQAPAAVFLVGGASKIPFICDCVSDKLGIDIKKVAVGGNKPLKKIVVSDCNIFNPEFVTPIGILITAAMSRTTDDLVVTINGERTSLFRKAGITVMDLLLSSGYRYSQMIGTSGKSLILTVNGEKRIFRGEYAVPATITVNGQPTSLFLPINGGDELKIEPAISGNDAKAYVVDVIGDLPQFNIILNNSPYTIGTRAHVNGQPADGNKLLKNNDVIETISILTLADICDELKINEKDYQVRVNDVVKTGDYHLAENDNVTYMTNEQHALLTDALTSFSDIQENTNDEGVSNKTQVIDSVKHMPNEMTDEEMLREQIVQEQLANEQIAKQKRAEEQNTTEPEHIFLKHDAPLENNERYSEVTPITPSGKSIEELNKILVSEKSKEQENDVILPTPIRKILTVYLNGKTTHLPPKIDGTPYLFLDMLNLVNIDPTKPQGNIVLRINNAEASYLMEISDGDTIDIYWDNITI